MDLTKPPSVTSAGKRSALPDEVVRAIFRRLAGMYGAAWADKWLNQPMDEVMRVWGEELCDCTGDMIKHALWNLDSTFPPSLPEFRAMCRRYRERQQEQTATILPLPRQKAGPEVFKRLHDILEGGRPADEEGTP